ncbi:DUF6009 family protein [Streptomyces zhihengii]
MTGAWSATLSWLRGKASRASGTFRRRVFWLLPHDRDAEPDGLYAAPPPPKLSILHSPATYQRQEDRALGGWTPVQCHASARYNSSLTSRLRGLGLSD